MGEKYQGKHRPEEFLISLSDLRFLWKAHRKKILAGAFCFALLGSFFSIYRPVRYEVEASFREKSNNKGTGFSSQSMSTLIMTGGAGTKSEAVNTMKSRKLMERVAKALSLQATINKQETRYPLLANLWDNLKVEYAYLRDKEVPVISDPLEAIIVKEVEYAGEIPLHFTVEFLSDDSFRIIGQKKNEIGTGILGKTFVSPNFKLTLVANGNQLLSGQKYNLKLMPLAPLSLKLSKQVRLETDKEDLSLIRLWYGHRNRHTAVDVVHTLMQIFQGYLKEEQKRVSSEQLNYLYQRQEEMDNKLREMMEAYAEALTSDMSSIGFIDTERAIQFLAEHHQEYKKQLLSLDFEAKREKKAIEDGLENYFRYSNNQEATSINGILSKIQVLKQQSDSIEQALRNAPIEKQDQYEALFAEQVDKLKEIREYSDEAKLLLAHLDSSKPLPTYLKLLDSPQFMIKTWYTKIQEQENQLINAAPRDKSACRKEWEQCKNQFNAYLANLVHFLQVQENTLQERLTHQQTPLIEFQGINLSLANELYMRYNNELNETQAALLQLKFLLEQMNDPDFEITSLSTVLKDPISVQMIMNASKFILESKDAQNRHEKDQERIKHELDIQKGFLTVHINQTIRLQQLHENLLVNKIRALQSAQLELIHQEISILERHRYDYVTSRLSHLEQEHQLVAQQERELEKEIVLLPHKWVSEKLIDQYLKMNQKMVDEITRLVENKNITDNLEKIQSAPLDTPVAPVLPKRPHIILFTILGGLFGAFFMLSFVLGRAVLKGMPVTKENLALAKVPLAGTFSRQYPIGSKEPLQDADLATLRWMTGFFWSPKELGDNLSEKGSSLLVVKGTGPDFSPQLANLLSKRGLRVLLMPIYFDGPAANQNELPGLLQCLEGEAVFPKVRKENGYDIINSGGVSRYSQELVGSARFDELLQKLREQYDIIIAVSKVLPSSQELGGLVDHFDKAVITISSNETLNVIEPAIVIAHAHPDKKIAFVLAK